MGIERSRVMTRISEVPGCGNLVRRQYDHYLKLKFDVNWRWGRNPAMRVPFARHPQN